MRRLVMRDPEQRRASRRAYYARNRERLIRKMLEYKKTERGAAVYKAAYRRYAESPKGREKARQRGNRFAARHRQRLKLMEKYGLTVAEWDSMLVAQAGRCEVCTDPMRKPCVDHRHADGLIRALLCAPCNVLVGVIERDPMLVKRAESYLATFA